MSNYNRSYYAQSDKNEKRKLKKWVIQAIVCVVLFSSLYISNIYDNGALIKVNNFRDYAMVHNTDFKAIYNNTVSSMTNTASMFAENNNINVFNNQAITDAEPTIEPTIIPTQTQEPANETSNNKEDEVTNVAGEGIAY